MAKRRTGDSKANRSDANDSAHSKQSEPKARSDEEKARPKANPWTELIKSAQNYQSDDSFGASCASFIQDQAGDLLSLAETYNILILFDDNKLVRSDADKIYTAIKKFDDTTKSILLILFSGGGQIEPAYLISKLCRENTQGEFHIAVPRRAKSAATLLSCGADKIHMGSLSELGPIDPQIGGLPALALKNAVEHLASLTALGPHATTLFAEYLSKTLQLQQLGYYERVAESAAQYAERLIQSRRDSTGQDPRQIANALVYDFKDHGFVIDAAEARRIFGENMIAVGTDEYRLADSVYESLTSIQIICKHFAKRDVYFIGGLSSCVTTWPHND